jgi:hypothetical protein
MKIAPLAYAARPVPRLPRRPGGQSCRIPAADTAGPGHVGVGPKPAAATSVLMCEDSAWPFCVCTGDRSIGPGRLAWRHTGRKPGRLRINVGQGDCVSRGRADVKADRAANKASLCKPTKALARSVRKHPVTP